MHRDGTAVREFTRRGAALISKLPDTHVNHVTRACFLWMRVIPQLIACTVSNRSTPILLFIEESYFSNFFNQKATPNWKLFASTEGNRCEVCMAIREYYAACNGAERWTLS